MKKYTSEVKEESDTFFNNVKGKKIRMSDWPKDMYIIPNNYASSRRTKIENCFYILGTTYKAGFKSDFIIEDTECSILNGFNRTLSNLKWEYYNKPFVYLLVTNVKEKYAEVKSKITARYRKIFK